MRAVHHLPKHWKNAEKRYKTINFLGLQRAPTEAQNMQIPLLTKFKLNQTSTGERS